MTSDKLTLYIVRGLPGSGKSTLAKTLPAVHLEMDMFREASGEYVYNRALNEDAAGWVYYNAAMWLSTYSDVVLCGTYTTLDKMYPLFDLAERYGAEVKILEATEGTGVSIHNVPPYEMTRMKEQWEELPNTWEVYKYER